MGQVIIDDNGGVGQNQGPAAMATTWKQATVQRQEPPQGSPVPVVIDMHDLITPRTHTIPGVSLNGIQVSEGGRIQLMLVNVPISSVVVVGTHCNDDQCGSIRKIALTMATTPSGVVISASENLVEVSIPSPGHIYNTSGKATVDKVIADGHTYSRQGTGNINVTVTYG